MPDLTTIPALEVAIGLVFLYFLLSIVCSSIAEIVAAIFRMRAKNLETGIRTLLGSKAAANQFYENWRIKALGTPKWRNENKTESSRKPSYISANSFALAVLDTFAPATAEEVSKKDPNQRKPVDVLAEIQASVAKIDNDFARKRLQDVVDHARKNVDAFRISLEDAFNDVMDRATGWYKRKIQLVLAAIALLVVGGLNADTINVADRLFKDDALRTRVVVQAQQAAEAEASQSNEIPTAKDVEEQIQQARATGLPLGWTGENIPDEWHGYLLKAAGIVITAAAIMLGAPFWFDVLGKLARLRSTGNRIGTPKDDDLAPVDRDDRLRRAPPGSTQTAIGELASLAQLQSSGLLTDDEVAGLKARLLR